jgi:hypothetical protein
VLRRLKLIFSIALVGFVIIQVLPFGRFVPILERKPNPPVIRTIEWDSSETHDLARMACFDCHSNETVYPWYSHIAPVSWLVTGDVNKGRKALNFSEDDPADYDLDDLKWHLYNDMPPPTYLLTHPEARLTDEQRAALMTGFEATFTEASHEGMDMSDDQ